MTRYTNHSQAFGHGRDAAATATLVARVSRVEHAGILRLAQTHDRTPSREVRRAIRFYLAHFDLADRALRDEASETPLRCPDPRT